MSGLPSRRPGASRPTEQTGEAPAAPAPAAPAQADAQAATPAADQPAPAKPAAEATAAKPAAESPAAKPAGKPAAEKPAAEPQPQPEPVEEGPRTSTGLPMRRPMATGITEHTGTPATRAEAQAEAAANEGKRGWLRLPSRKTEEPKAKGRGKAAAAAAAAAEAEEEHRMPANLTAWLDHRAKLAEARAEAEAKANGTATDTEAKPGGDPTSDSPSDGGSASTAQAGPATSPATSSAGVVAPASEPMTAPVASPVSEPVGAPVASDGFSAAAAAMAPADQATTPFNAFGPRPSAVPDGAAATPEPAQPAAPVESAAEEPTLMSGLPRRQPGASGIAPSSAPSSEDTPIFRAMGSPWLANPDGGQVDSSWSPAAAAGGPSAGAGEPAPSQATSSGLPVRRPGTSMAPGTAEGSDGAQPAPRAGRDPESIRRSLSRHQTGVSSARSQTPLNGTPDREEADVPH
jgi:hypothetical protein